MEIQHELMALSTEGHVVGASMALTHLGLGEKEQALEWLEKAFERKEPIAELRHIPLFDELRSEPRFQELIHRLNLPD